MSRNGRLLHFVYKIADRKDSVAFYRKLGMKVLRHEEFVEGCEAQVSKNYERDSCWYQNNLIKIFTIRENFEQFS